jgi:hypothetical protein
MRRLPFGLSASLCLFALSSPQVHALEPAASEMSCGDADQLFEQARARNDQHDWDAALRLARQVPRSSQCLFTFVKTQGLISRILVFELHHFE